MEAGTIGHNFRNWVEGSASDAAGTDLIRIGCIGCRVVDFDFDLDL